MCCPRRLDLNDEKGSAATEADGITESFVDVIAASALPPESQKTVVVGFTRILLCNADDALFAVEDKCPHALQPLAGGEIEKGAITCPKHGACFSLATGKPLNDVATRPIKVFDVRVRDDRIEINPKPR
jgi:3-phenylpropionate/trans-cinnamate dioxygenase ferredoxin component